MTGFAVLARHERLGGYAAARVLGFQCRADLLKDWTKNFAA